MHKILLRAPVCSASGYGHQSRFALRTLRKFPERFDIYIQNINWGMTNWTWEDNEERRFIDETIQKTILFQQQGGKFDYSLQVTIPSEWENLAAQNIGYTAGIETTKISTKWLESCFKVNKIIVTSEHARYAFDHTAYQATNNQTGQQFVAKCETPIEVVGYPCFVTDPKEIELELELLHDFNFLSVCQWSPRKNLEMIIKCFIEEFHERNVGLILKVNTMSNCRLDRELTTNRLKNYIQSIWGDRPKKCSIHLLHGDLNEAEMTYLYKHPRVKAMINLSHGEGWGLPLFEAAYNGLPLIGIDWSGQCDFTHMPIRDKKSGKTKDTCMMAAVSHELKNVQPEACVPDMILPDSQWAFPKELHARMQMKDVYKNYGFHKSRASKLQEYVLKEFELNKMLTRFADAICENYPVIDIGALMKEEIRQPNPNLDEVISYD